MPELPEVQTIIDTLRPKLLGRRILSLPTLRADIVTPIDFDLTAHLAGRSVADLTRRGKRIVFELSDGNRFYIHLGMTGRLTMESDDAPVQKHTHFILKLAGTGRNVDRKPIAATEATASATRPQPAAMTTSLRFRDPRRFGGIWWLGSDSPAGNMGPEPLLLRPKQLARRLARTTRAIKNVLLDQTVIAGIGNIYADESLFLAGIHPLTPANQLNPDQIRRLTRAIKLILRRALRFRGSTLRDYVDADGVKGAFQSQHRVYDQNGKSCRNCRNPIERLVLGGRSAHFCPKCQPAPLPVTITGP